MTPPPSPPLRPRLLWAAAIAVATLAGAAGAEALGLGARSPAAAPALGGARWVAVADAGDAVRVWLRTHQYGRVVVLLTGRWARLSPTAYEPPPPGETEYLDAENAVFAATRDGVVRALQVGMPAPAFERRRAAATAGGKELPGGPGWMEHDFHGLARRFSVPAALAPSEEPVLVLVEPSFFDGDGGPAPDALLRARGIPVDLGLVALADPEASPAARARAAAFAASVGAQVVEVPR